LGPSPSRISPTNSAEEAQIFFPSNVNRKTLDAAIIRIADVPYR
jgi:hypothetical protein